MKYGKIRPSTVGPCGLASNKILTTLRTSDDIVRLRKCLNIITLGSAEAEGQFSTANNIVLLREILYFKTTSDLVATDLMGKLLEEFDVFHSVKS